MTNSWRLTGRLLCKKQLEIINTKLRIQERAKGNQASGSAEERLLG
jgi:hypothetical protein